MATDTEALLLRIEASASKLEKDMAKATQVFDKSSRAMERRAKTLSTNLGSQMGKGLAAAIVVASGPATAALAALFAADKVLEASQAYTRVTNTLKVAGLSGEELTRVYQSLFRVAQENAAPIEALAELYSKAAQAQDQLGASSETLIQFTDVVAKSLRVSGKSASEASGALLQLGQVLSGGKVQAEEYNSLIDGAYPLLQAVAAGIKEAGGSVAKLTALVKEGKVSNAAFFDGARAGASVLDDKLAGAVETNSQAWTKMRNAIIDLSGSLDGILGVTRGVVFAMEKIAEFVEGVAQRIQDAAAIYDRIVNGPALEKGYIVGPEGYPIGPEEQAAMRKTGALAPAVPLPPTKPKASASAISISDAKYRVSSDKKGTENDYDREIRQIKEKTAALELERSLIGKSAYEVAFATEKQKLLTDAEREGLTLTPARLKQIDEVAAAYAKQTEALEAAKEAQQQAIELQRFAGEQIASFFSDIISGGENAEKAMMNLIKRLADAALQAALLGDGPLAGLFGTAAKGGGVGGLIGTLFKGLSFDGGGYTGAGGKYDPAGLVHRGEYVFDAAATRKIGIGNLETMRRMTRLPGFAGGGPVSTSVPSIASIVRPPVAITIGPTTIDARGADAAGIARLEAALAARDKALPAQIVAQVRDAIARGKL